VNAAAIAAALDQRKLDVLRYLLPAGRITGHEFCAGSLRGEEGKSLKVNINGKGCVWSDFATGDKGGDLLDLWAAVRCGGDIKAAMSESAEWLGVGGTASQTKAKPPGEPMQHPTLGKPVAFWAYYTADAKLIGYIARFNTPTKDDPRAKEFRTAQWRDGKWDWSKQFDKPRPLYRLPDLAANPSAPVLVVEGEKTAEAVHDIVPDYIGTTWPGGSGAVGQVDFAPLRGRDVVLWPDADERGFKAMATAAKLLAAIAGSVRMVEVPANAPPKWDIADRLPEGWSEDTIERLIAEARPVAVEHTAGTDDDLGVGEWDAGDDDYVIQPRGWLLGTSFCRGFISSLIADGAVGKTAVRYAQALAITSGRDITGEHVFVRGRVLIVTLEDDRNELRRRIHAAMLYHGITQAEIKGRLFLAAAGRKGWKLAVLDDNRAVVPSGLKDRLVATIKRRGIDLVILDPFVKTHACEESDNPQMDRVMDLLAEVAETHNIAVDTPHHTSKGPPEPGNASRGRGAGAIKCSPSGTVRQTGAIA
jgi:hypothetical protein